jgi:hypothetical protein
MVKGTRRPGFSVIAATVTAVVAGVLTALLAPGAHAEQTTASGTEGRRTVPTSRPQVPAELRPPAGHRKTLVTPARGVQIYTCAEGKWDPKSTPAAGLFDHHGHQVGIHFRGPSWQSTWDGSLVEASVAASSPVPGSIPQLLLKATTTRGSGTFGAVTFIQRLATRGGSAPTAPCKDGQQRAVPYTAEYRFFVSR